jgi:CcmD family protein
MSQVLISRLRALGRLALLSIALSLPGALFAQPAGTSSVAAMVPDKKLPPGFERVAGAPEQDKVDANPLVVTAYAAFFVFMFGYVVYVARNQAAIAKEMADLAERIRRAEKK